jgi:hypothetical protein
LTVLEDVPPGYTLSDPSDMGFFMKHRLLQLLAVIGAVWATTAISRAEFTVVRMHPAGAIRSVILGVDNDQQVGWVMRQGLGQEATVWTGSNNLNFSLHPRDAQASYARSVHQGTQVGIVYYEDPLGPPDEIAALWTGTPQYIALGEDPSQATFVRNGIVTAILPSLYPQPGAGFWAAPNYKFTQLGNGMAEAYGTDGDSIVGWSYPQGATLWFADGRPEIALMPGQVASWAYGVYGEIQVGRVGYRAALWHGSAASYVDLGPIGVADAAALAVHRDVQVGWVIPIGQHWRASLWRGSLASRVDLHSLLPSVFVASKAESVWVDDYDNVYIGGWGDNGPHFEALMWVSDKLNVQHFQAMRGFVLAGGLASLRSSDDDRLVVRPGITFGTNEDPIQVEIEGFAPIPLPSNLTFWIESHASSGNVRQAIQFYNFRTQSYEQLTSHTLSQTDAVKAAATIADVGRFVEPGTRRVKVKIGYRSSGPVFAYPWEVRIDRTWWTLRG